MASFPGSHSKFNSSAPIPDQIPGPEPFLEFRIAVAPAPREDSHYQVTMIDHRKETVSIFLTNDDVTLYRSINNINALGNPLIPADPRVNYRRYMEQHHPRQMPGTGSQVEQSQPTILLNDTDTESEGEYPFEVTSEKQQ